MDCTKFPSKFWTNQEISLLATVLISRPTWDLISEIRCPLLDSAAPWEVRSCSCPYVRYPSLWETDGKPGKTQETFLTERSCCKHRPSFWRQYSVVCEEKIFLIKSSSAKISRWIFSEGRREARFFMSGISPPEIVVIITLNELLFKLIFQSQTFQSAKFDGRIFCTVKQTKFFGVSAAVWWKNYFENLSRILLRLLSWQSTKLSAVNFKLILIQKNNCPSFIRLRFFCGSRDSILSRGEYF